MSVFSRRLALPIAIVFLATGCWSQYRGDGGHSGHQPLEWVIGRGNASTLDRAWVGVTGGAVISPATVANGVAFVVANDRRFSAFDAAGVRGCSGSPKRCTPLWTALVADAFQSPPVVAGGVAYFQGLGAVYAFDAAGVRGCSGNPKTCRPLWTTSLIGYAKSAPTVADGTLFATGASGLNAFDASGSVNCSGSPKICTPLWTSHPISPRGDGSPAVSRGSVYVSDGSSLFVYDAAGSLGCSGTPRSCAPRWRASAAGGSPVVVAGTVYLAGGPTGLNAFDAAGKKQCAGSPKVCTPLWSTTLTTAEGGDREPPAVADGVVYLPIDGAIFAFDAKGRQGCGGTPLLCSPSFRVDAPRSGSGVITGAPTVANHVVYSGASGLLAAYDATGAMNCAALPRTCDPLWTTSPGGAAIAAPVVVGGTVFGGSSDGLHAFALSARAPAPMITGTAPTAVRGTTTTVAVTGAGFTPGLSVSTTIPGASLGSPTAVTSTRFTVRLTIPDDAATGVYKLRVTNPDQTATTGGITFETTLAADVASRSGVSADPILFFESPDEQAADLDAIAALGGKWISIDVLWHWIQRDGPGTFHWKELDAGVIGARARGLSILGTASYSPTWAARLDCVEAAQDEGHCMPAQADDFAAFVGAAAARYGSKSKVVVGGHPLRDTVTHWQFWNEPNNEQFARPRPDPVGYAAMLRAGYLTVKAADPTATVVTGGTAPAPDGADGMHYSPETWLRLLYAYGARGSFDAVGHHPYSFPTNPLEPHVWNAYTQTMMVYGVMVEFGDAQKKVWGTEMGAPTGTSVWALTDADQAQWVHDYYLGWNTGFAAFTGPMTWKALRDLSADPTQVWDNTGLLRFDRTQKPAYPRFLRIMTDGL